MFGAMVSSRVAGLLGSLDKSNSKDSFSKSHPSYEKKDSFESTLSSSSSSSVFSKNSVEKDERRSKSSSNEHDDNNKQKTAENTSNAKQNDHAFNSVKSSEKDSQSKDKEDKKNENKNGDVQADSSVNVQDVVVKNTNNVGDDISDNSKDSINGDLFDLIGNIQTPTQIVADNSILIQSIDNKSNDQQSAIQQSTIQQLVDGVAAPALVGGNTAQGILNAGTDNIKAAASPVVAKVLNNNSLSLPKPDFLNNEATKAIGSSSAAKNGNDAKSSVEDAKSVLEAKQANINPAGADKKLESLRFENLLEASSSHPNEHKGKIVDSNASSMMQQPAGVGGILQKIDAISPSTNGMQMFADNISRPIPVQMIPMEIGMKALNGETNFQIKLDPKDLGRVDVQLTISDQGEVNASLVVDRPETLQLLKREASTLERAFEQAGLRQSADGLSFSLRGEGQGNQNKQQYNSEQYYSGFLQVEDGDSVTRIQDSANIPMRRMYSSSSKLDVSI